VPVSVIKTHVGLGHTGKSVKNINKRQAVSAKQQHHRLHSAGSQEAQTVRTHARDLQLTPINEVCPVTLSTGLILNKQLGMDMTLLQDRPWFNCHWIILTLQRIH